MFNYNESKEEKQLDIFKQTGGKNKNAGGLRKSELWVLAVTAAVLLVTAGVHAAERSRVPAFSVSTGMEAVVKAEDAAEDGGRVNLNTAGAETLKTLKGVGDVLAERIIAWREENGPFRRVEDIMKVKGIGASVYEANYGRMTVEEEP